MPDLENGELEALASSPDVASQDGGQDSTPQSSSGQDTPNTDQGPTTMAEAIEAAYAASEANPLGDEDGEAKPAQADDKAKDPDPAASTGTAEGGGTAEAELPDEVSDDEMKAYKPSVQKRVKQLLSQRNEFRRKAETLEADAGSFQNIRNFMQQNNLVDAEVAELYELGADLKSGKPERLQKFLDRVMPTVQAALEATGRTVPQDLRPKVEQGEMTEDAARQFGQERANRIAAERAVEAANQRQTQVQQTATVAAISDAVGQWEQQTRLTDPDFGIKAGPMQRAAQALVAQRGLPTTPQQALEFAKAAYEEVNGWFKQARPAAKATRPAPAAGGTAHKTGLPPVPTTLDEVIKQALEASTRR